jgi:hypothetical protein
VRVTAPSTWPWLDHLVSGLLPATERPIQTRFRCAYTYRLKLAANRNSLTHYTKGTPSHQKVLRLLVGIRFQVSFTPLVGVLFTFPSRYLFTIGHQGVFRLGGWSPHVQTGFHVSRLTQGSLSTSPHTGLSPALAGLSRPFCLINKNHWPVPLSLATTDGISVDVFSSRY